MTTMAKRRKKIFASLDQFFELRDKLEAAVFAKLLADGTLSLNDNPDLSYDIEWTPERECLVHVLKDNSTIEETIQVDLKDLAAKYLTEAELPKEKTKKKEEKYNADF
jgi:hypothetical protein